MKSTSLDVSSHSQSSHSLIVSSLLSYMLSIIVTCCLVGFITSICVFHGMLGCSTLGKLFCWKFLRISSILIYGYNP
jgi:hypothetical protein